MAEKLRVDSQIDIPRNVLSEFSVRLGAIKQASPSLFNTMTPVSVSDSESYFNRVDKITRAKARGIEFRDDAIEDPHVELNSILFMDLAAKEMQRKSEKAHRRHLKTAQPLPIIKHRQQIINTIANNQVVLIRGETGCGKSTQVPQFILDHFIKEKRGTDCRIVCTQPRRVAAIAVASRVAIERQEELGGGSVGFLIRCENELPRPEGGHILYVTVGVLLRQLQSDPTFRNLTHIIVDEIHERSTESDVLLAVLKILLPLRPDLRVVIMSATIEMDQFSNYFGQCPMLEISGFNHVVQEVYLGQIMRDINMPLSARDMKDRKTWFSFITNLIVDIHVKRPPGAILVFCSGYDEIEKLYINLKRTKDPSMKIYILHSLVPVRKDRVFAKPKEGERKIVLSTNVAESSITIEDAVYVIDNGRLKIMSFAVASSTNALQNLWITKANARQRKGRAGRCQDGFVFRLYEKTDYEKMQDYVRASVTYERLDSLILDLMVWNFGPIKEFLASLLSPPAVANIDYSLAQLEEIGAITDQRRLTKFGRKLSSLHLDPQLGTMMIYAAMFNCLDPITTVVAFLSYKDVFMLPLGNKRARRDLKNAIQANDGNAEPTEYLSSLMAIQLDLDADQCSDHMTRVKAVQEYVQHKDSASEYCYENYLNESTMIQVMAMRSQIINSMVRNKFIARDEATRLKDNNERTRTNYLHMIRSVICAGLYPNTAVNIPEVTRIENGPDVVKNILFTPTGRQMQFHKGSVNVNRTHFDTPFFVYHKAVSTDKVYLHDSTMVHGLALCLFSKDVKIYPDFVVVDDFYHFCTSPGVLDLIVSLRAAMKNIFTKTINRLHLEKYLEPENQALQLIADILAMEEYSD